MMRRRSVGRNVTMLMALALGLSGARGVYAATIAVTTCAAADLIAAINAANTNAGVDVIELPPGCTYTLTAVDNTTNGPNGLPVVTDSVVINGHGSTITRSSGAPAFRLFDFAPSSAATFALNDLTISGGLASFDGGGIRNGSLATLALNHVLVLNNNGGGGNGGGIYNAGALRLADSTVAQNDSGGGGGGGVFNDGGTFTATGSTLAFNRTADEVIIGAGGGLFDNFGTSTLTNCTVSGNSAEAGGGIYNLGTVNLNNVTVAGNFTVGINPDTGGGIFNFPEHTVNIRNSIIALNTDPVGPDCRSVGGGMVSGGYNLIGDADDCNWSAATGDQVGSGATPINPLLGLLRNNGGPTMTRALLPGSPAIDAANPGGCLDANDNVLTTDQRGFPRPVAGDGDPDVICDIGAFEVQPAAPTAAPALSTRALAALVVMLGLIGIRWLTHARPSDRGTRA